MFKSLWEIWSVPPWVGETLFLILWVTTTEKSNIGTTKINSTGLRGEFSIPLSRGIQSKIILVNPSTYPTKSVPESPKYSLAGG